MTKNPKTTNLTPINRRQALAGAGAVAGALAIADPVLAALPKPDRLEMLIRRYNTQTEFFDTQPDHITDDEANALAEATFDKTLVELTGVPATTAAGALAALAFIEREKMGVYYPNQVDDAIQSLMRAVRGYIEHGVQS